MDKVKKDIYNSFIALKKTPKEAEQAVRHFEKEGCTGKKLNEQYQSILDKILVKLSYSEKEKVCKQIRKELKTPTKR